MVDHDDLEDSSVAGVTGTGMATVTLIILIHILSHAFYLKYPAGQKYLISIFLMPVLIGWVAWVGILKKEDTKSLDLLVNLFETICLVHFLKYIEKMLGCIFQTEKNIFSEEVMLERLSNNQSVNRICFKINKIETTDKAMSYLRKIRVLVYQNCVVLIIFGLTVLIVIIAESDYNLENDSVKHLIYAFHAVKGVSGIVAILSLVHFGLLVDSISDMAQYQMFHKLITLKLGILFTEIQPNIIAIASNLGAISNKSIYSVEEMTAYTNSLLLCFEMVLLCCLILLTFPNTDYKNLEDLKMEGDVNDQKLTNLDEATLLKNHN